MEPILQFEGTNSQMPRSVRAHTTPCKNSKLASVPLAFRPKSDGYRDKMDRLVGNDTKDFRWCLSKSETRGLLDALFPDSLLFQSSHYPISMSEVLNALRDKRLYGMTKGREERWLHFPKSRGNSTSEKRMAAFLNRVLGAVEEFTGEKTNRKWHARGSQKYLSGSYLKRKPDLVLSPGGADSDWRDVLVFGEMKSKNRSDTQRTSYTEVAGKTSVLLYTQDGRHAAPSLRILGSHVALTFFDRGGSLETHFFNMHTDPEIFLRIIIALSTATFSQLGFDLSLLDDSGKRRILIEWKGDSGTKEVTVDNLLFISDVMHGRGTTVWAGSMTFELNDVGSQAGHKSPQTQRGVIIKDTWIDLLRKYTEGSILALLNASGVVGVPTLQHEEQVQGPHPSRPDTPINMSTHLLRSLLSEASRNADHRQYQLRVLSRLITEPVGLEILEFNSLAELLVAFIDYVLSHKDAVKKAEVLHRDISLFNLLLAAWDKSDGRMRFLDVLSEETRNRLHQQIKESISYRGLLVDWGYAVPINSVPSEPTTRPCTPNSSQECDEGAVPTLLHSSERAPNRSTVQYVPVSKLGQNHEVKVPMAGEPVDPARPSIDTNPLYRTGMWSWMAAELVIAGPGQPVVHRPAHDLESMFYVLVGICVLLNRPHEVKAEEDLLCFDTYFNSLHPSNIKTTTIQSNLGWAANILPYIAPYFQPLIPLLNKLRERIVCPMDFSNGHFVPGESQLTHEFMRDSLLDALCNLQDNSWVPIKTPSKPIEVRLASATPLSDSSGSDSESTEAENSASPAKRCLPVRIPRPPPICAISGSGFSPAPSQASSGSVSSRIRRRLSSIDPDLPADTMCLRPTPRSHAWYSSTAPSVYGDPKT